MDECICVSKYTLNILQVCGGVCVELCVDKFVKLCIWRYECECVLA